MRIYLSILLNFVFVFGYTQSTKNENLANEYYRQGEFSKASQIFEQVYKKKKIKSIYIKYIDCLIQIQSYNKAERVIKTFYKKTNDPTILVNLGELYLTQGETKLANKKFEAAINQAKKNTRHYTILACIFFL